MKDRLRRRPVVVSACAVLSLVLWVAPASGQVRVRVQSRETLEPLAGAIVALTDSEGQGLRARLSDRNGLTFFADVADGTYRLRVEMIGRATELTESFQVPAAGAAEHLVRMGYQAIPLEGVDVAVGPRACQPHPLLFQIWDDVRKALTATVITEQEGMYRFRSLNYDRRLDDDQRMISEEQEQSEWAGRAPYVSLPSGDLAEGGFVREVDGRMTYYGPDANVLLSEDFLRTHCFQVLGADSRGIDVLGLGFEPLNREEGVADISGTLWVDRESRALRWLDYEYAGTDPEVFSQDAAGFVQFRRMPVGTWIVSDWWIRIPDLERSRLRRRWMVRGFIQRGGHVLQAMDVGGGSVAEPAATTGLEGVAVDADGVPLSGIPISASADGAVFTTTTLDDGSFSLLELPGGNYEVEARDPRLAVFGYTSPSVEQRVTEGGVSRADIRLQSLTDALTDRCRTAEGPEPRGDGMLAGFVYDPETGGPAGGIEVVTLWEASRTVLHGWQTTSDDSGAYLMCGLPANLEIQIYTRAGDLTSSVIRDPGDSDEPLRWMDLVRPVEAPR